MKEEAEENLNYCSYDKLVYRVEPGENEVNFTAQPQRGEKNNKKTEN